MTATSATSDTTGGLTSVYACPDGTPFPVEWKDPADAAHGWRWDQMHCPLPLTPLSMGLSEAIGDGFRRGADALGSPARFERAQAHGYRFTRSVPFTDDLEFRAMKQSREMESRGERLLDLWNDEYRPEVEALTTSLRSFDRPDLSLRQLVDRFDQVHAARKRLGELHVYAMMPAQFAANRFIDFCIAELGPAGERLAGELTQGFPNKSLESANALWELSQEAKERPEVGNVLRSHSGSAAVDSLGSVEGGRAFLELLDDFLDEYGLRNESFAELSLPTWREDPSFPLYLLRSYLDAPDESSPAAMHERVAKRRQELTGETEGRLASDEEKLATFRAWQRSAQQRTVILEDHNFYIDQRAFVSARVPCLAIGRRLAEQGAIDAAEDVFYLTEPQIQRAALDATSRFQALVEERRLERERWMHILPPSTIGDGSGELPVAMARFFGPTHAEPQQDGVIKGIPASAGVVRGTARLVRTLGEVDRLARGEILVTYATAPPWTPLFAVAAAVVTDTGGMLSHCAVVAREYGIPAVVGSKVATQRIADGALITVDGTAGTVRIEG